MEVGSIDHKKKSNHIDDLVVESEHVHLHGNGIELVINVILDWFQPKQFQFVRVS